MSRIDNARLLRQEFADKVAITAHEMNITPKTAEALESGKLNTRGYASVYHC